MKIDLIYLWVDGSDPNWIIKKNSCLPKDQQLPLEIAGDCRFVEHDELKYSLRSVEKFADWINHVYIITDNQVPSWLDTSNPRVSIVDHKEVMDEKYLPTYNSTSLELCIHKIKGLADHFLYANDDMLFGRKLDPSFFFDKNEQAIVRLAKQKIKGRTGNYQRKVYRMQMLVKSLYGRYYKLAPHHNIDAYRKSDFQKVYDDHAEEIEHTFLSRFRNDSDIHRSLVLYDLLARESKSYVKVGRYNGAKGLGGILRCLISGCYISDSRCFSIKTSDLEAKMKKYNPALFTINDESSADDQQRANAIEFLNKLLPDKSSFELDSF